MVFRKKIPGPIYLSSAIVHNNRHLQELAKEKYISLPPGLLDEFEWHFMLKSQNNLQTSEFGESLYKWHRSYFVIESLCGQHHVQATSRSLTQNS